MLTYTSTETDVSFGLFIPEIHFFGQGLTFFSTSKRVNIPLTDLQRTPVTC